MTALPVPLSVLDLAPVGAGATVGDALRSSLDLAVEVERLGYTRHWVAEHHNMPGIASSSPAVLLAHIASVTSTIRIGSGGVMLPNHSPLVIAEQFGMLEALHPGRVDLGIGRAPGTDQVTMHALRRTNVDDFPDRLAQLLAFFEGSFPEDHPYRQITAVPGKGHKPAIWLLGSSDWSAQASGQLGLPFSFAHHFASGGTDEALAAYRASFTPSDDLQQPYATLGVSVLCAPTDEEARYLAGPGALAFLRLRTGRPGPYPTPEEAADFKPTPFERQFMEDRMRSQFIGAPETVRTGLEGLLERTRAQELMVTTMAHSPEHRQRSYRLLAEVAELKALTPV